MGIVQKGGPAHLKYGLTESRQCGLLSIASRAESVTKQKRGNTCRTTGDRRVKDHVVPSGVKKK